jgi:predicted ATPase/DNA-binding SARP family transcriptional activator
LTKLKLYLLGSPIIEREGEAIRVDTRKAIALLAYLAVTGIRHGRDTLATLLWPESDSSSGRAALRRTLSSLNRIWLDVDTFAGHIDSARRHGHKDLADCKTCIASLNEAVDLYRDEFLAGFTLRDSPAFDDWQFIQTEHIRRELAWALEHLAHAHSAQRSYETAISFARRWLSLDPLHEPVHQKLMRLYSENNQRSAALGQYRECVRILDQELGVSPLEETTRLYELLRENRIEADATAALPEGEAQGQIRSGMQGTPTALPFVGRSEQLATLLDLYAQARDAGHVIGLEGEPGIGKTRLAAEFCKHVGDQGGSVLTARCREGEAHLPYGPIIDLLRGSLSLPTSQEWLKDASPRALAEAVRLLPELQAERPDIEPLPEVEGPAAQTRFYEGVSHLILALVKANPGTVLFIDDLGWADTASQDLLAYLIRRLIEQTATALVTWRSGGLTRGTTLMDLFARGQGEGWMTIVPLERLNHAHIEILIEAVELPVAIARIDLAEVLYAETEGLPLFLAEYLKLIASHEQHEVGPWQPPSSIQELLRARVAAVPEIGRQLLTAAATIGRSFDLEVLREASGRSEEETVTAIEMLLAAGLIMEVSEETVDPSLTYDFYHNQFRRLIYEDLSLARRRLLHRRIAHILVRQAEHSRDPGVLFAQIAHHNEMARQDEEAANNYYLAGEHARQVFANREALSHFNKALALQYSDVAGLHERLGDLHTLLGEYALALGAYEAAAATGSPIVLTSVEHKIGQIHHRLGEWELAESHYRAAIELAESVGTEARITADWSLIAHRRGDSDVAIDLASRALELASAADDPRALAQAHNILGILARNRRETAKAKAHLRESLAIAESLDDLNAQAATINNLSLAFSSEEDVVYALELAVSALELCKKLGDHHREAAIHSNIADLLHAAGRAEEAIDHLKRSAVILAEIGKPEMQRPEVWKLVEW